MKTTSICGRTLGAVVCLAASLGMIATVRATLTGCYGFTFLPCGNAPSTNLDCTETLEDGTVRHYKKTVWFVITTTCSVEGNYMVPVGGGLGNVALEPSLARSCQAQGYWPDCQGKKTAIITLSVTCNTQTPDLGSAPCNPK
jgi:hypothetical protein